MALTLIKEEIQNIQETTRSDCVEKFPLGEMVQGPKKVERVCDLIIFVSGDKIGFYILLLFG